MLSSLSKHLLKRPQLFNDGCKQIPLIWSTATYRSCKSTCPSEGGSSGITVKYVPYIKKTYKDHDHKNMTLCRPMSPHLTIYGPTVPAMTSITQRGTGIALSALSFLMAALALSPSGVDSFIKYIQSWDLPEPIIIGLKTVIAFAFTFHFFTGLRFVFFNLGKGLELKTAYKTAYAAIFLSIVSAAACGIIGHAYSL